jgi:hypothetical protein
MRRLAVAALEDVRDDQYAALFRGWLGVAECGLDRVDEADRSIAEASRAMDESSPMLRAIAATFRAHLDLARARACDRVGDSAGARRYRESAGRARGSLADLAVRSLDARRAAAALERAFARDADAGLPAIVVDVQGRWFALPGGERIACGKRQAIRRMLVELARQRLRAPGEPLAPNALVAAGWAGERIDESAAMNRLYVSLNRLRKLGLEAHLLRNDEGWYLDPALTVRWSREGAR